MIHHSDTDTTTVPLSVLAKPPSKQMTCHTERQLRDLLAWHSQFVAFARSAPAFARRSPSIQLAFLDIADAVEEMREEREDALKAARTNDGGGGEATSRPSTEASFSPTLEASDGVHETSGPLLVFQP